MCASTPTRFASTSGQERGRQPLQHERSIRNPNRPRGEVEMGETVDALVLTKEDQDGLLSSPRSAPASRMRCAPRQPRPSPGELSMAGHRCRSKGGLIIDLGCALPARLAVDIRRVPKPGRILGHTICVPGDRAQPLRNTSVLSRRAVLERPKEKRQQILEPPLPGASSRGRSPTSSTSARSSISSRSTHREPSSYSPSSR